MRNKLKIILSHLLAPQWLEREISFVVDMIVCLTIAIFPAYGGLLALIYFLFRDVLPIGSRMSIGKSVYRLKVVDADSVVPQTPSLKRIFVRNIVSLIPFVNLYDLYLFLLSGERLADQWSDTKVVKMTETT